MSYAEDIRGALAAAAGVSRRVMALKELGLPESDERIIVHALDQAVSELLTVKTILEMNGFTATAMQAVTAAAKGSLDKSWRETVYGGAKDTGTVVKKIKKGKAAPKNNPPAVEPEQPGSGITDLSHPWRA